MNKLVIGAIFFINLAVLLTFWWLGSGYFLTAGTATLLIALGRLAGLLAEFTIMLQLILISRVPFVEKTYGFDKLNRLHRRVGYSFGASILIHPTLLILGYAKLNDLSLVRQLLDFITNWEDVLKAVIGLSILLIVVFLSLPTIRKMFKYETWHASHLFMYVAIFFFFSHQVNTADVSGGVAFYYWYIVNFTVFGLLVLYRFLHPFILYHKHKFTVLKVVEETHDVTSVYITGKNMADFKYDAGQYLHVSFFTKKLWQPHPFSLSVAQNGAYIRLSIKAVGDYTSLTHKLNPGTKVLLEGPFGRFTEKVAKKDKYLFIAGGIGITPIRSMIEYLSPKKKDMILLYANKTAKDIAFKDELQKLPARHVDILSIEPESGFEKGYIDEEKIKRLSPDFIDRDIYVCGPPPMTDSILLILKKIGVPASQIHFEKFAY